MKLNYLRIALLGLIISISCGVWGQQINTLYFMKNIEERSEYNPAFQPINNVYWDLPITPNYRFEIGNNSVSFNKIIFNQKVNGIDSTITFLHPAADKGDFLKALKDNTRVYSQSTFNIIGFGFRVKKNYFTFNMSQKSSTGIYIPKDFFRLAMYGTDSVISKSFNLDKFGLNSTLYSEIALGYSRKINDKLTLGITLKYLMGQANVSTDISKLRVNAGIDQWQVEGKGTINSSVPFVNIPFTTSNKIDMQNITTNSITGSDISNAFFTSNYGLGVDLGATYKILKNLELSAAITDLGFIRWRKNVTNATYDSTYNFNGIYYQLEDDVDAKADSVGSAFEDAFTYKGSHNAYTTYLSSRLNLGAEYSVVHDKIGFGLLSSTLFINKSAYTDLTSSLNLRPYDWFSTSFSYSLLYGQFSTMGLGFQLKMLPFNMYFAMDQIPLTYTKAKTNSGNVYIPSNLKYVNFQAGIVCSFGNPKKVGDDDKDGVKNKKDECPNTPYGWLVDKKGCPLDADKDGVPDNLDKCPNTPQGVLVDSVGCPFDTDKDGVYDYLDKCPNTPIGTPVDSVGCSLDTDKDGVVDYLDKCPNTPQGVQVDSVGCPLDSDKDGVADYLDKCPNTPAEARSTVDANGCPIDTDGDGVADYKDKCPGTPVEARGKVDEFGCPLDTDKDGVADFEDNCPTIPGTIANHGCPEIKAEAKKIFQKALQGIQFETGKAIIKPSSFGIMNQIVKVLQDNPTYLVMINGHTDNVGKQDANQILSEKRANAVKDYLVKKGVNADRMTAKGYGDMIPVESNATPQGRAKNRRVEFIVKFEE